MKRPPCPERCCYPTGARPAPRPTGGESMTMTCPEPGRLRAWLDDEAHDADALALVDHLATCAACQTMHTMLDRDAEAVACALNGQAGPSPSAAETEQALARLHRRLDAEADLTRIVGPLALAPTEPPAVHANGR